MIYLEFEETVFTYEQYLTVNIEILLIY